MRTIKKGERPSPTPVKSELAIFVQDRVINQLNVETKKTPLGHECVVVPNDISLLIDQQKLMSFNPSAVQAVIGEFRNSSSPLSDALKDIPDEDILSTVKSRYIQSVGDMSNWSRSLQRSIDDTLKDIKERYEAAKAAQDAPPAAPVES